MNIDSRQLVVALRRLKQLTPAELDSLVAAVANHTSVSADQLAEQLVKDCKLSRYQAARLLAGKVDQLLLGDYVLVDRIGKGGMGEVYEGWDPWKRRRVAIKRLAAGHDHASDLVARFRREIAILLRLNHPNVVRAYDAGEQTESLYLVMEFLEGQTLQDHLDQHGPSPLEKVVGWMVQAARGLGAAHGLGIIHRDVKPLNLWLAKDGLVKVLDLGLARLREGSTQSGDDAMRITRTGFIIGTPGYMAPEQLSMKVDPNPRLDIYSLGCCLYNLAAGRRIYEYELLIDLIQAHVSDSIPSLGQVLPNVPRGLDDVFQRMVAKSPADRFASMAEVETALTRFLPEAAGRRADDDDPIRPLVPPLPQPERHPGWRGSASGPSREVSRPSGEGKGAVGRSAPPRRKWRTLAIAVAILCSLMAAVGIWWYVWTFDGTVPTEPIPSRDDRTKATPDTGGSGFLNERNREVGAAFRLSCIGRNASSIHDLTMDLVHWNE